MKFLWLQGPSAISSLHTHTGLTTNGNFIAYRHVDLDFWIIMADQMANPTILLVRNKINLCFPDMQQGTCHDLYSINILGSLSLGVLGVIK